MESMNSDMRFKDELWNAVELIYADICLHPFVNQLANGTLSSKNFAHYLAQDILYIRDDSIALKKMSERATNALERKFFKDLAKDGISIEQELHNTFLKYFKLTEAKRKSPVIESYTSFLLEHVENSSYCVAAAALLPCFWVYNEVGKYIIANAVANNTYQKWIETYKSDEFGNYVTKFIQIVEHLANNATNIEKKQMREAFVQATRFEFNFFEESISI